MFALKYVTAALVLGFWASEVAAQMPCTKRDDLIKYLGEKYSEASVGYGLAGQKSMIEIYVSEKGTFTIISTMSSGMSCIIAAGQNWEVLEPPKKVTAL